MLTCHFEKNIGSLNMMVAVLLNKGENHVYSYVAYLLFFNDICKPRKPAAGLVGEEFCPITCMILDFICSAFLVILCCIFHFMMHQFFSFDTIASVFGLEFSCWNMQGLPCKRCHLDDGALKLLENLHIPFAIDNAFPCMQAANSIGRLFNCVLITWMHGPPCL